MEDHFTVAQPDTPLRRQLNGTGTSRPTALDAFRRARHAFQEGQRIDMQTLAAELGVNRATLYRWVGSREQLLCEVLWSLTESSFEHELHSPPPATGSRLAGVLTRYLQSVVAHPGMRRFLEEEGEFALRLLTLQSGGFQERILTLVRDLISEEIDAGRLDTPIPVDDLAYTVVRIAESYVHRKAITGEEPDADRAGRVLQALLPPPPAPDGTQVHPREAHSAATG